MDDKYRDDDPFKKYDQLFDKQDEKYHPATTKRKKEKEPYFEGFKRPERSDQTNKKLPFWMIFIIVGIFTNIVEYKFLTHMTFIGWIITAIIIIGIVKAIKK